MHSAMEHMEMNYTVTIHLKDITERYPLILPVITILYRCIREISEKELITMKTVLFCQITRTLSVLPMVLIAVTQEIMQEM